MNSLAVRLPFALALALLLLAACTRDAAAPGPTPSPTQAPASATPAVTPTATPGGGGRQEAQVIRVIDGDTIEVLLEGEAHRVRYIGIDTPETVDPRRPVGCYGREASRRNRELVEGKTVLLEKDISEADDFGRLLRYVWMGDQMVNVTLVREGYAAVATFPPDVKYADLFLALQREAREAGRGLWGACLAPSPTPSGGVCDFSGTGRPVIKGNISHDTGEKIYHVPGGEFYDETVIDESRRERWFCTEGDAVAAGWRKSRR